MHMVLALDYPVVGLYKVSALETYFNSLRMRSRFASLRSVQFKKISLVVFDRTYLNTILFFKLLKKKAQ